MSRNWNRIFRHSCIRRQQDVSWMNCVKSSRLWCTGENFKTSTNTTRRKWDSFSFGWTNPLKAQFKKRGGPTRTAASCSLSLLNQTWDDALAITARAWARRCLFEHNIYLKDVRRVHPTFPSVGENIWTGYPPSSFDATRAIKKWVDEKQHYDYGDNNCTRVCGHYTQVCLEIYWWHACGEFFLKSLGHIKGK